MLCFLNYAFSLSRHQVVCVMTQNIMISVSTLTENSNKFIFSYVVLCGLLLAVYHTSSQSVRSQQINTDSANHLITKLTHSFVTKLYGREATLCYPA